MPEDFTKEDIIRYIEENGIRRLNFRYVAGDGRLKTLNFIITSKKYLDSLLSSGERVDGSSLFPFLATSRSDLYVVPRFRTAFLNPFTEKPTVDLLCSYYESTGKPFPSSPENILRKAHETFQRETGLSLHAMGELEYYTITERNDLYPIKPQKGYKESQPFTKMEHVRVDAMDALAQIGCAIKYGHSEVGCIYDGSRYMEQSEVELLPVPIEDAADHVVLARWAIRMVGMRHGVTVSFAPKITVGHAGSGLHIHMMLVRDGKNVTFRDGKMSDETKKMIAGILKLTPSLTSFGNTVPTSYLRLVPHQEAPTNIVWGEMNRTALIRVPLGWHGVSSMVSHANPKEKKLNVDSSGKATIEFRCPDGSADIYQLLAGIAVAARYGFAQPDAIQFAEKLYVKRGEKIHENIQTDPTMPRLPSSCDESADMLERHRDIYEMDATFPTEVIDGCLRKLRSYNDRNLNISKMTDADIKKLTEEFIHCA